MILISQLRPLERLLLRVDKEIVEEVSRALLSGWITTGPRTKEFEKMLTNYGGHASTLCVSSASAGLELVLRWYGVKEGDEVILPIAAPITICTHSPLGSVYLNGLL